jgi:hypothetical protein
MNELLAVRQGIFWTLTAAFLFGASDRLAATIVNPSAQSIALLSVSSLCFALFLFLKPQEGE